MSSVLSRKRGISEMEFYRCATEIRATLTRALMNDNIVPKRWKQIMTMPTIALTNNLVQHLLAANNAIPYNLELLAERKRNQRLALNDIDAIDDALQYMLETLYYNRIDADHPIPADIEKAGDLLDRDDKLIRAWRKGTKLISANRDTEQYL